MKTFLLIMATCAACCAQTNIVKRAPVNPALVQYTSITNQIAVYDRQIAAAGNERERIQAMRTATALAHRSADLERLSTQMTTLERRMQETFAMKQDCIFRKLQFENLYPGLAGAPLTSRH